MDKVELEKKQDEMRLCGRNRGDHAYIPIVTGKKATQDFVMTLMCTRCFLRTTIKDIIEFFPAKP